jgi:serine/threonine-protein kinase
MGDDSTTAAARRFGRYEIVSFVGRSGGARVYRARQVNLLRLVTLTILPRQEAEKAAYRIRFERQIEAASKLRHPNILSAIDAGTVDGHRYIVSEHVGGRRLSVLLGEGEPLPVARAVEIALGIARALAHMDSVGILHRNLTPRSILLGESGEPKLRGFSFSRPRRDASRETWFDTDDYAAHFKAPDVMHDKELDVRADVYSLGCVLYFMLTGRPPFPSANAAIALERHVRNPVPDPRELRGDLPEALVNVLLKALEKDREQRYGTPEDLVADLEAVEAGRAVAPPKAPRRPLFRRRRRRGR